jgi:uncharacterized protein (TIGR00730 family)
MVYERAVAVFGSSEPTEGQALYEEAREVGRLLAARGFTVVTGGYGGVMEGASRGAREGGGTALGVTCALFEGRRPNAYLTEERRAGDLFERTRILLGLPSGYVVLHGKSGTLAELAFLWALSRAGSLEGRTVVLLGDAWARLLELLSETEMLEQGQRAITRVATAPLDAVLEVTRGIGT